jgi:hypothetical protein
MTVSESERKMAIDYQYLYGKKFLSGTGEKYLNEQASVPAVRLPPS